MNLDEIKANVNLIDYARKFGIDCNSKGFAICPFHVDEKNPSFEIRRYQGHWTWKDWHDNETGTIVDLAARMEGISNKEAIEKLLEEFGTPQQRKFFAVEREHIYLNEDGKAVIKKVKFKKGSPQTWALYRQENGEWIPGLGNLKHIPYNLHQFKDHEAALVCEGEKDADAVNQIGLELIATTAPCGKGVWPEEITRYFRSFKKIIFIYDVGAEEEAESHAHKLLKAYPELYVSIAEVPLPMENADITDYLERQVDKKAAINYILATAEEMVLREEEDEEIAETVEEIAVKAIPDIEYLIKPIVERGGYTLIGGIKGIGKSLFVTQLGLFCAAGKSPFITPDFIIEKPGKVLLIQQEVSLPGIKDRLLKMRMQENFDLEERFRLKTTTGRPWDLTEKIDFERLIRLVEKYSPDMLILDPLYTFSSKDLNNPGQSKPLIDKLLELKSNYNLALVVVHHFSNKKSEEFSNVVGKFMYSSTIANAADNTIAMEFLDYRYKETNLNEPFNHYCTIEIGTRHGEWPEKFCAERRGDGLLFYESRVWEEIGRKIVPGQIEDLLKANDNEMRQGEVIETLSRFATRTTIVKAINEAISKGNIEKVALPGKGKPKMLRILPHTGSG